MNQIKKIIFYIRAHAIRVTIIAAVILLIISAILRVLTPPPVQIPTTALTTTNIRNLPASFHNLTFSGSPIHIPNQLSIAKITSLSALSPDVINKIVTDFNLQLAAAATPDSWSSKDYTFYLDTSSNDYFFLKNSSQLTQAQPPLVNADQATQVAQNFVQKYFSNQSLSVQKDGIQYLIGDADVEQSPPNKATLILIPFSYTIDNTPVFIGNKASFPLSVLVDGSNQIVKVEFSSTALSYQLLQKNNLISLDRAIQNINNQKAAVIAAGNTQPGALDLSNIQSGNLQKVWLEYHTDDKNGLIYPFYRFRGNVTDNKNNSYFIELITPAVETVQ